MVPSPSLLLLAAWLHCLPGRMLFPGSRVAILGFLANRNRDTACTCSPPEPVLTVVGKQRLCYPGSIWS
uniref:Putative secreted protein n=1 Tax=Ixodes ricinus TaxID=34613 RepID=A0A6B0TWY6_IXORI